MQQGLLASILLFISLLFGQVSASEIQPNFKNSLLNDQQLKKKVEKLHQYIIDDDTTTLNFSLNRLSMPQQEAVRFMLLQNIEKDRLILSPAVSIWLKEQLTLHPTYTIKEQGDGYVVTKLAFDYSSIAARVLNEMKKNQQVLDFILAAEEKRLILSEWLTGEPHQVRVRQSIVLAELDSLTPEALDYLVKQLTDDAVSVWLPTTEVMVRLAQVSKDPGIYKILWRMRTDQYSLGELDRLSTLTPDAFATEQLIAATKNPSLKQRAFASLAQLHPLPQEVQHFLLAKLDHIQDGGAVAMHLANYGHVSWLESLVSGSNNVRKQHVKFALSQN
ncbi:MULTISPECIES: hypothetical protein [Aliivibrio]|uniref:hypothetical protein n=1 Tax=Aliivibrio TaxID=511678 RepID=UPI00080E664E|nr:MULTISPECIES: hypothetical protein [Aliivibrio]MBD1570966.1 hypothetical protein [Aliivibrio sp. S10_S31]OCH01484.1 hypothetical protein A6E10_18960 [Aliivibrio fischeri]OCH28772.1 hypothetical protein A6E12_09800 [Aliivibrio fischeri]OCH29746.1 hypothetical protein A6E13_06090 [Aliivibrio fischeri]OCH59963.1 hypothetical protein A6D98_13195 [Aliivibrio fischeri]